jgi:hypothetical protein
MCWRFVLYTRGVYFFFFHWGLCCAIRRRFLSNTNCFTNLRFDSFESTMHPIHCWYLLDTADVDNVVWRYSRLYLLIIFSSKHCEDI